MFRKLLLEALDSLFPDSVPNASRRSPAGELFDLNPTGRSNVPGRPVRNLGDLQTVVRDLPGPESFDDNLPARQRPREPEAEDVVQRFRGPDDTRGDEAHSVRKRQSSRPAPPPKPREVTRAEVLKSLGSRAHVRRGLVLQEILGPPRSLRDREEP